MAATLWLCGQSRLQQSLLVVLLARCCALSHAVGSAGALSGLAGMQAVLKGVCLGRFLLQPLFWLCSGGVRPGCVPRHLCFMKYRCGAPEARRSESVGTGFLAIPVSSPQSECRAP